MGPRWVLFKLYLCFFNNKLYFTASNLQNTWYRRSGSWQWQKQALCECFLCSLDTDLYFTALIYKICDIKEVKASSGENRPKWHNWCCLGLRWVLFKLSSCFLTITHILRHVIYKICDIEEGVKAGSGKNDDSYTMVSWSWVTQVWVQFPNFRPKATPWPIITVSWVFYSVVMSLLNTLRFRIFFLF